jgi:hypothetical protein
MAGQVFLALKKTNGGQSHRDKSAQNRYLIIVIVSVVVLLAFNTVAQ